MYQQMPKTLMGTQAQLVKRLADNAYIPFDETNKDYQAYLKWLDGYELQGMEWVKTSDGNTPLPADEPSEGTA
jgi:hypothetical protein